MKKTLYLLPGLLCDDRVWHHQQEHLSTLADIRIPDFRDFNSLDAMAQSVLDEAPDNFFLAGHSMGGRVAMQILDLAPDRILKLGLLNTGWHPVAPGEKEKRQLLIDLAREKGMYEMAKAWTPPMVHPERQHDAPFMETIFDMVASYTLENFQNQIHALLTRPDAKPFLTKAPQNSLLLSGRQDGWSPPGQHEEMAEVIPDHPDVVIIENSGHMSIMEQPLAVSQAMEAWLLK